MRSGSAEISESSGQSDGENEFDDLTDPLDKKLYKPTGPDGNGWGDFRKINPNDLELLEEMRMIEEKEEKAHRKSEK